jgi:phosphate transport system protein
MNAPVPDLAVTQAVDELFGLVSEALAGATEALLGNEPDVAQVVIDRETRIDALAKQAELLVWEQLELVETGVHAKGDLRQLVATLLMLSELERSADLAEHVAQRALTGIGNVMTPRARGIIARMAEAALDMWATVSSAYQTRADEGWNVDEADEEIDILHERLTAEIAGGDMDLATAAQVTLLARFYERLGDHAVNLARRIGS